jgi:hypothetical protein
MEKILRIGRGVKVRRARVKEICDRGLKQMDVECNANVVLEY